MKVRKTWVSDDMYVRKPHLWWVPVVYIIVLTMVGFAATTVLTVVREPGPLRALASGLIGLYVAGAAMMVFKRLQAYRWGWLDGRSDMLRSMHEAHRAGLSVEQWATQQAEKDVAAMFAVRPRIKDRTRGAK